MTLQFKASFEKLTPKTETVRLKAQRRRFGNLGWTAAKPILGLVLCLPDKNFDYFFSRNFRKASERVLCILLFLLSALVTTTTHHLILILPDLGNVTTQVSLALGAKFLYLSPSSENRFGNKNRLGPT